MSDSNPNTDGGTAVSARPFGLPRWVVAIAPVVLLGLVVGGFFATTPLASLDGGGEPLPDVTVSHTTLPTDESVVLHVTNNGPGEVTISQVLVDDAYWNFDVRGAGGDSTLAPRESARVVVPYHWNPGWDLGVALVLSDGSTVHHTIVAPNEAPGLTGDLLVTLAVIGLFVGVIPIVLGMLWFPFLQSMSDRGLHAILAFSAGLLGFLAFDAGFEAFELADSIPGAFEGPLLVTLGVVGTLFVVQSLSEWRSERAMSDGSPSTNSPGTNSGLRVAYLVAIGIGLHNLAEGLAIGSSFALGRVSLGAFLVVGFMLHNVTEGPAVVAPVTRGARPSLKHFVALGAIAGLPVILGGWIGSLAYSPTVGAFFLAVGVGAMLQVRWDLRGLIRRGSAETGGALNLVAFVVGFAVMYATDLLVAL